MYRAKWHATNNKQQNLYFKCLREFSIAANLGHNMKDL